MCEWTWLNWSIALGRWTEKSSWCKHTQSWARGLCSIVILSEAPRGHSPLPHCDITSRKHWATGITGDFIWEEVTRRERKLGFILDYHNRISLGQTKQALVHPRWHLEKIHLSFLSLQALAAKAKEKLPFVPLSWIMQDFDKGLKSSNVWTLTHTLTYTHTGVHAHTHTLLLVRSVPFSCIAHQWRYHLQNSNSNLDLIWTSHCPALWSFSLSPRHFLPFFSVSSCQPVLPSFLLSILLFCDI